MHTEVWQNIHPHNWDISSIYLGLIGKYIIFKTCIYYTYLERAQSKFNSKSNTLYILLSVIYTWSRGVTKVV